ncbi:MAG: hypothetical protein NVSMB32_06280 [Actinomycetota bacterium]
MGVNGAEVPRSGAAEWRVADRAAEGIQVNPSQGPPPEPDDQCRQRAHDEQGYKAQGHRNSSPVRVTLAGWEA